MSHVIIYTKTWCPFSRRAKALLGRKGVVYEEVDLIECPARRDEMIQAAGGRTTVPQVFIHGRHVGGCDDLHALDDCGQLDALLAEVMQAEP